MRNGVAVSHGSGTAETVIILQWFPRDQPGTRSLTQLLPPACGEPSRRAGWAHTVISNHQLPWHLQPIRMEHSLPTPISDRVRVHWEVLAEALGEAAMSAAAASPAPAAMGAPRAPGSGEASHSSAPGARWGHPTAPHPDCSDQPNLLWDRAISPHRRAMWGTAPLTPSFAPGPCHLPCGAGRLPYSSTLNVSVIKCVAGIQAHLVSTLPVPSQTTTPSCAEYTLC